MQHGRYGNTPPMVVVAVAMPLLHALYGQAEYIPSLIHCRSVQPGFSLAAFVFCAHEGILTIDSTFPARMYDSRIHTALFVNQITTLKIFISNVDIGKRMMNAKNVVRGPLSKNETRCWSVVVEHAPEMEHETSRYIYSVRPRIPVDFWYGFLCVDRNKGKECAAQESCLLRIQSQSRPRNRPCTTRP